MELVHLSLLMNKERKNVQLPSILSLLRNFWQRLEAQYQHHKAKVNIQNDLSCLEDKQIMDILYFMGADDLFRWSLTSKRCRYLTEKYIQNFAIFYFNRRAFDLKYFSDFEKEDQRLVWIGLTKNWNEFFKGNQNEVRELLQIGILPSCRRLIWKILLDVSMVKKKNPDVYSFCLGQKVDFEYDLETVAIGQHATAFQSLQRLDKFNSLHQRIRSVLKAFASFHYPEIEIMNFYEYKGIEFVIGVSLLYMEEEDSFWMLVQLMKSKHFQELYHTTFFLDTLDKLTEKFLPELSEHFRSNGIKLSFVTSWFQCMFANILPLEWVFRIWDLLLFDGPEIILCSGLAILKLQQDSLKRYKTLEEVQQHFSEEQIQEGEIASFMGIMLEFKSSTESFISPLMENLNTTFMSLATLESKMKRLEFVSNETHLT